MECIINMRERALKFKDFLRNVRTDLNNLKNTETEKRYLV
jgi:hypothetical protein